MIRILLNGADGRMGSRIESLCADQARGCRIAWRRTCASGADSGAECDVVVDFSSDAGLRDAIGLARGRRVPLVSGTTGLTDATRTMLADASREIPALHSANMSLGVAVMRRLVEDMACALHRAAGTEFTMEIVETHHVHKLDAPSGTALALAGAIDRGLSSGGATAAHFDRSRIESVRHGEVIGDHEVRARGPGEILGITHHAVSRDLFALGALRLAAWIVKRPPGMHTVDDWLAELLARARQGTRP
ncbi:MAG: 4-hydroxy-tetrahydrodipicolinate reductase [Phycisphaerales bacterium]|nr:4-hydroxy-tetrahydrodipicolinate reductase [Phycisphaerales bacterium]